MTASVNDVDCTSAPQDYAVVFHAYFPNIVNFVAQLGIDDNNKEDVASEIFLRFMERSSLEKYDPNLSFDFKGESRPARFKNYLFQHTERYTRGHRDRLNLIRRREWQIFDLDPARTGSSDVDSHGGGVEAKWGDIYGDSQKDHADEVLEMLDEESEAATVRALLAQIPRRNGHDRCDLAALYDAVRAQVLAYGEYDIAILKDKFNISSTAMHGWMWWLKENLANIYGVPMPSKRPRRTRPREEQ